MDNANVTRKEVKTVLAGLGIHNKFSLRTTDFTDLARASAQFVYIKNWAPPAENYPPEYYDGVQAALKKVGVCHTYFNKGE